MSTEKKLYWGGGCGCVVILLVTILILVLCSYDSLEPTEVGLEYNPNSKNLNTDELYKNGRHNLGIGHYFIKFPTELQQIKFQGKTVLQSRTKDGLSVHMTISFQYKLKTTLTDLVALFYDWGDGGYDLAYRRIARAVLRDTAAEYEAYALFYERTQVSDDMISDLSEVLDQIHATVENFQLLDISLPSEFENAIRDTENENINIETLRFQRENVKTEMKGLKDKAVTEKQVIVNSAEAKAEEITQQAQARIQTLENRIDQEIAAYKELQTTLGLTEPRDLNSYVWIQNVGTVNSLINLGLPSVIKCFGDPDETTCPS
mmetsp:Transcript_45910/g.52965  ORF Transcript_45910/g.52965 Transcript_45910/m.52965 type:complete len:318 (+) Transcript_45910:82-1035(+)